MSVRVSAEPVDRERRALVASLWFVAVGVAGALPGDFPADPDLLE